MSRGHRHLGVYGRASSLLHLRPGQVALDDGHGLVEFLGQAELDDRGAGGDQRQVAGRRVVGVAGHVGLLVVGPPEGELTFGDDPPVLTLAAVAGQPDE